MLRFAPLLNDKRRLGGIKLGGKIKEQGKQVKKYEEVFGVNVIYFDGAVSFRQKLKLKGAVKTHRSVSGGEGGD